MEKIGLLAGVGTLPVEFAEAVRSQGYEVVCVAVIPGIDPRLKEIANVYYDISAFKLNKIIKTLVKENVKEVTMIGKVTKEWLYKDHVLPDLRAIKVLNRLRKANFKDDTITLAIVEELAKDGISVLDQTKYLKPLMPGPQVFTKKKPTEEQMADVAFGFKAAKAIGAMDLGQTVVVKTAKPNQDTRFDMPAIGLQTLRSMEESGCAVLAIEAYHTLFAEKDEVLKEANNKGIVILAAEQDSL